MHAPEAVALDVSCLSLVSMVLQAGSLQEDYISGMSEMSAYVVQPSFVFHFHRVVCNDT